jgi:hypothetical protein
VANTKFWGAAPINNQPNGQINQINNLEDENSGITEPAKPKFSFKLPSIKFPKIKLPILGINRPNLLATGGGNTMKKFGKTGAIVLGIIIAVGVFLYFLFIRPGLAIYSTVKTLKTDGSKITTALQDRDLVELTSALDTAETDLKNLQADKDKKFGWAKNLKLFKANEFYSDSDRFINAGLYTIDALRETSKIVTPFADAAGLKVSPDQQLEKATGLMKAFQGWISVMPQVADQMDGVIATVAKIGDELAPINVDKYPKRIGKFAIRANVEFIKNTLSKADNYAPDIKRALQIFPKVLAVGTPEKRYMIIMQNDKEIRPTGGFMTNYATFRILNGLLGSDFSSKDMYSVDLTLQRIDAVYTFPSAPTAYTKLLKIEHWFARDMNYSPDFVTSMDQFMKFYNMAGTINPYEVKPVNGIFAIDTNVISELLDVTGPVTVNGVTYSKDNVVLELEKIASLALAEQSNRKKVLGDLMQGMLINVFNSDSSIWPRLIEKAVDLAVRKHISVYIFDPDAQALVDHYGLGGRITDVVDGDYSMVVSTNLGGDKTNWFTTKAVTHTLEKSGTRWMDTVKIKYTYTQPSDDYAALVKRFRDWVRVYAPVGSELVSTEGSEDQSLNITDQERNKVWYSAYLELGPGESKEITFKYFLPANVVTGSAYNLTIQKQAGIDKETHSVIYGNKKQDIDLTKDTTVTVQL